MRKPVELKGRLKQDNSVIEEFLPYLARPEVTRVGKNEGRPLDARVQIAKISDS
jgi:hypothetical protein